MQLDALMQAISSGDADEVDQLISGGADVVSGRETPHPRYFTTTTMTPLGWAAYQSSQYSEAASRHIISALLAAGVDATVGKAILFASTLSSIEQLAQAGAPLNVTMTDGYPRESGSTVLMFRAEALDFDSVDLLVTLSANGSLVTANGETALDYGIRGNNTVKADPDVSLRIRLVDAIARSSPPLTAFSRAMLSVAAIDLLEVKTIIDKKPPPTERKEYNRYPVSVRPILELLESYGGVPTGVIEDGPPRRNILMLMLANRAFRYAPYDELSWLCRKYGFSLLDDADSSGQSVLFYVFDADNRYPRFLVPETQTLARLFLGFNSNPNYRDNTGATVLHKIVRTACRPKGSVSPDPFPCDGEYGGACMEFRQTADLLIAAGADPKLTDYSGKTPGHEAHDRPKCPFTYLPMHSVFPTIENAAAVDAPQGDDPALQGDEQEDGGRVGRSHEQEPDEDVGIDVLWMRQSAALLDLSQLPREVDADEPNATATAEDPEVARLDPAVIVLYRSANQKYLASSGHVDPYIQINPGNGRRSTVRQAQLYEQYIYYKYYGGPGPFAEANRPGKSKHEYGYAMDVIKSSDEQRLANALSTSGWDQTVEDEAWHWEAVDAPRYSALSTFIDSEMDALSEQWALKLSSFYERRKESLALLDELQKLRVDLARAQQVAEGMRQQLAQESAWLANEERQLQSEYDEIISLDQQVVELQHERANKRYTYCPNGQSYANCTHTALKQQYDNELRQLDQAIQSKRSRRMQLARDYDLGRRDVVARRQQYAQKEIAWRAQLQQVNLLHGQVTAKQQQVSAKQAQMQGARSQAAAQLTGIVAKVSGWK